MHNLAVQSIKFALPVCYIGEEVAHEDLAIRKFYFTFSVAPI